MRIAYDITVSAIGEVLQDLRNVRQKPEEVEKHYVKHLNESIFQCCNVHSDDEKITLYVDRSSNTIIMVVACYRESV